jgi:hypothetical protein
MSTNTKERGRASVIMMRGHGEQRLRQAMMQGLVREEIASDVEELLQQIDDARREHEQLTNSYRAAAQRVSEYERIYYDAVGAFQREEARKKKNAELKNKAKAVAILFIIVLVSTIICNAIFG